MYYYTARHYYVYHPATPGGCSSVGICDCHNYKFEEIQAFIDSIYRWCAVEGHDMIVACGGGSRSQYRIKTPCRCCGHSKTSKEDVSKFIQQEIEEGRVHFASYNVNRMSNYDSCSRREVTSQG